MHAQKNKYDLQKTFYTTSIDLYNAKQNLKHLYYVPMISVNKTTSRVSKTEKDEYEISVGNGNYPSVENRAHCLAVCVLYCIILSSVT